MLHTFCNSVSYELCLFPSFYLSRLFSVLAISRALDLRKESCNECVIFASSLHTMLIWKLKRLILGQCRWSLETETSDRHRRDCCFGREGQRSGKCRNASRIGRSLYDSRPFWQIRKKNIPTKSMTLTTKNVATSQRENVITSHNSKFCSIHTF